jgi:hypothetical protein
VIDCAAAAGRDDVIADIVLSVCDSRAAKTAPEAFPARYGKRRGWAAWAAAGRGVHRLGVERETALESVVADRARRWFADLGPRARCGSAVLDAEDRFERERNELRRPADRAECARCSLCGSRDGAPTGKSLRRCAGCADFDAWYCSKPCQALDWRRHGEMCGARLDDAGKRVFGGRRRKERERTTPEPDVVVSPPRVRLLTGPRQERVSLGANPRPMRIESAADADATVC